MKNLELKAELRDPDLARMICKKLSASRIGVLRQTDTYFNVARGRLKKRESIAVERGVGSPEPIEYIFYERPNRVDPKISDYQIYTHEQVRERFGTQPIPLWLQVVKDRELFLYHSVRIHLDHVIDLGWFFEFEILVNEETDLTKAQETAEMLIATFRPALGEPISVSYADLMEQSHQAGEPDLG